MEKVTLNFLTYDINTNNLFLNFRSVHIYSKKYDFWFFVFLTTIRTIYMKPCFKFSSFFWKQNCFMNIT